MKRTVNEVLKENPEAQFFIKIKHNKDKPFYVGRINSLINEMKFTRSNIGSKPKVYLGVNDNANIAEWLPKAGERLSTLGFGD